MTTMTKALAGLLLVACVLGVFLFQRNQVLSRDLKTEQSKAQALERTLTATQNSLNTYMARAKATTEREAKNQKELTNALESNRDWRDVPVPGAVFSGLYDNRATATSGSTTRQLP